MSVIVSREGRRGCGYRKTGGIYLVCDGPGHPCGILPMEMHVCPTCGQGIKPSRGWTWINPSDLFKHEYCPKCDLDNGDGNHVPRQYSYCRFTQVQKAGLIWVGEQFYPTPDAFSQEAAEMGISRRITCVPRGYVLGETWVLLAHRKVNFHDKDAARMEKADMSSITMIDELPDERPGIFTAFLPSRIEKIVDENISEMEVRQIEESGMTPVQVVRLGETQDLFQNQEEQNNED